MPLKHVRFTDQTMLWGAAYQYARTDTEINVYSLCFKADTIDLIDGVVILNGTLEFPLCGGGIRFYERA